MAENMAASSKIIEVNIVDRYDGSNFALWKMHMSFIFKSRDLFSIVNGTKQKLDTMSDDQQSQWEQRDKQAIVAILGSIDSYHKQEVIHCETSYQMWTQLQAYHDRHSDECVIALQEKFFCCKLGEGDSIASYISTLQKLYKQLNDLGEKVTEKSLIAKIRCGLPPSYDPLMLAWDSAPAVEQTLTNLQMRLVKFQNKKKDREGLFDVQADSAFFTKSTSSKPSLSVEQKKERAERLAKFKKHSRCYKCGR